MLRIVSHKLLVKWLCSPVVFDQLAGETGVEKNVGHQLGSLRLA